MSDFQRFAHLVWCHPCGVATASVSSQKGYRFAAPQAKGLHPCGVLKAHVFIHTGLACALSQAEGFHPCGVLAASVSSHKGFRCAVPYAEGSHPCGVWHKHISDIDKSGVIPAYTNSVVLPISEGGKDSCDHSYDYSCHESFPPYWKGNKAKTGKGGNDSCPVWFGCVQQQQIDYNII